MVSAWEGNPKLRTIDGGNGGLDEAAESATLFYPEDEREPVHMEIHEHYLAMFAADYLGIDFKTLK